MKINKILIVLAIFAYVIYFIIFLNYTNTSVAQRMPTSPDENGVLFTAQNLTQGSLFWHSSLNEKYDSKIFAPRLFTEISNNTYVSSNSVGLIYLISLTNVAGLSEIIISVMSILSILFVYLMVRKYNGLKVGIISAVIFSMLPTLIIFSNLYYDTIPGIFFTIISCFYFLTWCDERKKEHILLSTIFFAVLIFFRSANAIFILSFIAVIIFNSKNYSKRDIILPIVLLLAIISPLLMTSGMIYGNYFLTGQNTGSALGFNMDIQVLLNSAENYLVMLVPTILLFSILGSISHLKENKNKNLFIFWFTAALISILFYGFRGTVYGSGSLDLVGSMMRYFFPVYLLISVYSGVFLEKLALCKKYIFVFVIMATIILLIIVPFNNDMSGSLPRLGAVMDSYSIFAENLSSLPDNSIILTKRYDKIIFPHIPIGLVFTQEDVEKEPDLYKVIPISDISHDIIPLITRMTKDNLSVYVTDDIKNDIPANVILQQTYSGGGIKLFKVST